MIHRQDEIIEWARSRGILDKSTAKQQFDKFDEELYETSNAILANDRAEVIDGIGDCMVCIVIQCHFAGIEGDHEHKLDFAGSNLQLMDRIIEDAYEMPDTAIAGLITLAHRYDTTLEACIDHVLPIIQARKGAMNEHGIWVKESA